jgi:hypothetical protein
MVLPTFASFRILIDAKILWAGKEIDLHFVRSGSADQTEIPGIGMDSIAFTITEWRLKIQRKWINEFWEIMIKMYDSRRNYLERQKTRG